jgi:hypothetical protein
MFAVPVSVGAVLQYWARLFRLNLLQHVVDDVCFKVQQAALVMSSTTVGEATVRYTVEPPFLMGQEYNGTGFCENGFLNITLAFKDGLTASAKTLVPTTFVWVDSTFVSNQNPLVVVQKQANGTISGRFGSALLFKLTQTGSCEVES